MKSVAFIVKSLHFFIRYSKSNALSVEWYYFTIFVCILKLILDIKSFVSIIYHWIPHLNFSDFLYPRSTSVVKLCFIPDLLPLKIFLWAISVCMKILSNDKMSTGFGDILYSSHKIVSLNPSRLLILSSNTNQIMVLVVESQQYYIKY